MYADLRAQSLVSGGVPIAVRHIESVVRMSESFAKMHLRDHVRDDDVDNAIKVLLLSFLILNVRSLSLYLVFIFPWSGHARVIYSSAESFCPAIIAKVLPKVHHFRRREEQFADA